MILILKIKTEVCNLYLLAYLTIDFVSELDPEYSVADDEMELLQVGRRPRLQPRVVRVSRVLFLLKLSLDVVPNLVFPLEKWKGCCRHVAFDASGLF